MQKKQTGEQAEKLALSWLESKGYQLIQSNYARRVGEIDLIVQHPDNATIVFVEVRYRSSEQYGGALLSVNYAKQRRLVKTANSWLQRHASEHTHARIDVMALIGIRLDHMKPLACGEGLIAGKGQNWGLLRRDVTGIILCVGEIEQR